MPSIPVPIAKRPAGTDNLEMSYTESRHPINFVCRRTGLTTHLVRAWEKRYAAVVPGRTSTNRRLYSDADVDRLKTLANLVSEGHSIGQIAGLDRTRLDEILQRSQPTPRAMPPIEGHAAGEQAEILRRCTHAVSRLDGDALAEALTDAHIRIPLPALLASVVGPLLNWIGDEWHHGALRIANEHMATGIVRDFLADLRRRNRPRPGAPVVIVTTPSGEPHEFGALMAGISAAMDGWRDIYLGPGTPSEEIASIARDTNARAVALSLADPGDDPAVLDDLEQLRRYLPGGIPIFVGGTGARNQKTRLEDAGLRCLASLDDLRGALRGIRT